MNRWYHPEFETDLISASHYYEMQSVGLGRSFIDAAEATVETIMLAPQRWRPSAVEAFDACSSTASRF
ncbi:MAG: hypothetical protein RIQ79_1931 [Verrucomicrobiota bacterium]